LPFHRLKYQFQIRRELHFHHPQGVALNGGDIAALYLPAHDKTLLGQQTADGFV
jgi:hypothetical protein